MATAEYAQLQTEQLQAEQVSALRFPHWTAVRWCAAFLYVVALAGTRPPTGSRSSASW